jgi:hypothetical protein
MGSFVQALAVCFHRADPINFLKLKHTFHEYWDQYEEMAKSNLLNSHHARNRQK